MKTETAIYVPSLADIEYLLCTIVENCIGAGAYDYARDVCICLDDLMNKRAACYGNATRILHLLAQLDAVFTAYTDDGVKSPWRETAIALADIDARTLSTIIQ